MPRSFFWAIALLVSVTACASSESNKSTSDATTENDKNADSDPPKKKSTAKPPRPGGDGPLAAPPLSPSSPKLESLQPASLVASSGSVEITLSGAQFAAEAKVSIGGQDVKPSNITATRLKATVPAALLGSAASLPVKVQNPDAKGGSSNLLSLTVASATAKMTVTGLSPDSAAAGGGDVTLAVSGTGLTSKMKVRFNGSELDATASADTLTAIVPANLLRLAGELPVAIFDPATNTVSAAKTFSVQKAADSSTTGTCENRCVDFGYKTDQCYDDWQCQADGCLKQASCAASCQYKCTDYSYGPDECAEGWQCSNGCLAAKTCPTTSTSGTSNASTGADGTSSTSCTYPCNTEDWSYSVGECKYDYVCGADDCLTPKTCASTNTLASSSTSTSGTDTGTGTGTGTDTGTGTGTGTDTSTCDLPCVDPFGGYAYAPSECRDGWCCSALTSCLVQDTSI